MPRYDSEVAAAIDRAIGSDDNHIHDSGDRRSGHAERYTITGGLFAIATALNRLADALEARS